MTETSPAYEADDTVTQMLCLRNDELQAEKDALATQVDRIEEELAEAKRSNTVLKDTFANQVQQAVKRARMEWAREGKADLVRLKSGWQAAALETAVITAQMKGQTEVASWLQDLADTFRRQDHDHQRGGQ